MEMMVARECMEFSSVLIWAETYTAFLKGIKSKKENDETKLQIISEIS